VRADVTSNDRLAPSEASPARQDARREPSALAEGLVGASIRHPIVVIVLGVVLTLACLYVTLTRFAITTETDQLLQTDSAWGRDRTSYAEAFPHLAKPILIVVDGETGESADRAAARLTDALAPEVGGVIRKVWRPDGGPFFDRNGLLFLPVDEVRRTTAQLVEQAPILQALSGDPSLRGLLRLIQLGAGQGALDDNLPLVRQLNDVFERVLAGEQARLSWQQLLSGNAGPAERTRRFILVDPVLDYKALEPARLPTARIRQAVADLEPATRSGVRVRLTGAAPLADEEFATVRDGAPLHLGLTVVAIAVILYLALKSGRIIAAVLITTMAGLIMTIGAGLLTVGRFNVISVAVAALFLGLGVDFGIQVAVRYRDDRHKLDDVKPALRAAARGVGWSLTLAAMALLAGFFSFLPTSFKGVSELGLITGIGMIIAFVASLTLLPALITVLRPAGEPEAVGTQALASVDHWIHGHRKLVIGFSTVLVLLGLPLLLRLEFDANPMHLRSAETESVATFLDLTRQPGMTPNTLSVLAPSLERARELGAGLAKLPEVSRTVSLATFVPENQDEKLSLIRTAAARFGSFLSPPPPAPAPTDADLVAALRATARTLARQAEATASEASVVARRLAQSLTRLADAPPERRVAAAAATTDALPDLLNRVRALLSAEPVTVESLPASLRDDWLARDGRARIELSPAGDANDNAVLERFSEAVRAVAPNTAGAPVDVVESRRIIVEAFVTAALLALAAIFAILWIALRSLRDVALTLGPLVIATILTLEAAYLIGLPLNLANIIALPLMLAVGVNFHIYYTIAWRDGVVDMLASSLTRAIFFSALTTGVAFGSLWLSHHPGTASMGKLLTLSLFFTLLAAFVIVPAFLGPPPDPADRKSGA
jgi:hopanoid biosynthesis associated RND transporter like protein HpnN